MSTATANKLKIKDIITVVLLALINVVIFFASSVLYATPITIILMPVFFALLEGIVYFIIGTKVKKPGAILIYSIVRAIAAKAMADQMVTDGRQDTILAASQLLQSWVSVALVAGVIVAALIGAAIGKGIVKKHLAA